MSAVLNELPCSLGRNISFRLVQIGFERQPLMIVDDVLEHPQSMIDIARATAFYVPAHTNYPGINARLPDAYYQTVIAALRGPLEAAFGMLRLAHLSYFGFFGLATTNVCDTKPIQRIPHRDSTNPQRLAMVHYLCRGNFAGTGFFRHKSTGFESVDASRERRYMTAARHELADMQTRGTAFAGAETKHYELIAQSPAVFNRLIVYRSHVLHSALLGDRPGCADPARGRLTANGFLEERSG